MPIQTCWELAQKWYMGRLERNWERLDLGKTQQIFDDLGLQGNFWCIG